MPEYLTPEQVADRFSVKPKTVRDWLRRGDLIGVKLGRGWRVRDSDLTRFLEGQRLKTLLERAKAKDPDRPWTTRGCAHCGEGIVVPHLMSAWVCSADCKRHYDRSLAELVDGAEFAGGQAEVAPLV